MYILPLDNFIEPALDLLTHFYTENRKKFERFFYNSIRNTNIPTTETIKTAQDLTQDTFLIAVEDIDYPKAERVEKYMWRIARNVLYQYFRRNKDCLHFRNSTRRRATPETYSHETIDELVDYHSINPILKSDRNILTDLLHGRYVSDGYSRLFNDQVLSFLLLEINRLKKRYREPLVLHYFEHIPYEKIAEQLGTSTTTQKVYAHRGLEILRRKFMKFYNSRRLG